jgi:hypothetical protein
MYKQKLKCAHTDSHVQYINIMIATMASMKDSEILQAGLLCCICNLGPVNEWEMEWIKNWTSISPNQNGNHQENRQQQMLARMQGEKEPPPIVGGNVS